MFSRTPHRARTRLLFGTVLGCIVLTSCQGEPPARNVVLLSIDTLRADHLGCYGYHRNTSPRMDEFAARGVRFETVITPIVSTFPAHTAMLSSLYPPSFGITTNGRGRLSDSVVTLAEVLKEKGYTTGAFVSGFILDSQFGLDQGFDTYDDEFSSGLAWANADIRQRNLVHVWRILDEYADGDSYEVEIQHSMRGELGAFNFVAWADEDGDGLPDTLIGRSEKVAKAAESWSRWSFETDSKRVFVGYEFGRGTDIFSRRVEPPPTYVGLSTNVYCCPNRGDAPIERARNYFTNMRVTAVRSDGSRRTFGMTDDLLARPTRKWKGHEVLDFERRAEDTNRAAVSWLRSHSGAPFFLFVHYYDPHAWYHPPGEYAKLFVDPEYDGDNPEFLEGRWERRLDTKEDANKPMPSAADRDHMIALYDGEIAYSDVQYGFLLDTLSELNVIENTLVVLTSDHGEYMTEHGWCFGHRHRDLHDPILKVPLVIEGPDVPAGTVVECPVQLVDIAPTVLDLLGVERVAAFTGESLRGVMNGDPVIARTESYVFHEDHFHVSCLWTPEWKLVRYYPTEDKEERYPSDRLHNLREDVFENRNLIESRPDMVEQLAAKIGRFEQSCTEISTSPSTVEMDAESRRKLKALGYL